MFLLIPGENVLGSSWKRDESAIELGLSLMFRSSLRMEFRKMLCGYLSVELGLNCLSCLVKYGDSD